VRAARTLLTRGDVERRLHRLNHTTETSNTYVTVTIRVTDQKISETTAKTLSRAASIGFGSPG
jgi:hypothetical protein